MFSGSILLDGRFWALLFAVVAIDAGLRASGAAPARAPGAVPTRCMRGRAGAT